MPYAYVLSTNGGLLNADGSAATFNEKTLYPTYNTFAEEGSVSVIKKQYLVDGNPVYNFANTTDFTIRFTAINTTGTKYNSIPYVVYANKKKTKLLGSGTAVFDEDGYSVFEVEVSDYHIKTGDDITVDFTL